jgi:hypothetical protein
MNNPNNIAPGNHFTIKDSGSREEFSTGSKRDIQDGKPRYELIPVEPLHDLAMHYTNGAVKYGDDNWRKGQPIKRMFASLLRHTYAYLAGVNDGEDHGAAIAWNAFAIKWTRLQIKEGRLPDTLEDVFTGDQFREFYGRMRRVTTECVEETLRFTATEESMLVALRNSTTAPEGWPANLQEFARRLRPKVSGEAIWEYSMSGQRETTQTITRSYSDTEDSTLSTRPHRLRSGAEIIISE